MTGIITNPFNWNRRTKLEKSLLKTLFLSFFIIFAICIAQVFVIRHFRVPDIEKCSSKVCIKTTSIILNMINTAVNPCDNFYEFACGNFLKYTNIPYSEKYVDVITEMKQKIDIELEDLLQNSVEKNETSAFAKAQKFYNLCLNETKFDKDSFKVLHTILRTIGGWPMLEGEKWNNKTFDWIEAINKWKHFGYYKTIFFRTFFFKSNRKDYPKFVIMPDNPNIRKPKSQEVRELINYAEILGGNKKIIQNDVDNLLTFIDTLKQIEDGVKYQSPKLQLSVAEMQEKYPNIRWLDYLKPKLKLSEKVDNNTDIILFHRDAMEIFDKLFGQVSNRIIANYIILTVLKDTIIYIPIDSKVAEKYENPPRWKICLEQMKLYFLAAILTRYKQRTYIIEENQKELHEIIKNIRAASMEMVQSVELINYLDEEHKLIFLNDIRYTNISTDLPKEFLNDTFVDNIYKEVKINENVIFKTQLGRTSIKKYVDFSYFDKLITHITSEKIDISPVFLRDPIFVKERPTSMNYGSIGSLIGERIITSTDKVTFINFTQQRQCFRDHYSNYTYPGTNIQLNVTSNFISEMIILFENYGVRLAYEAYNKWIHQFGQDKELYGVNYNAKQLFWISYAQQLCQKKRSNKVSYTFYIGSIPELQVLGSLRNSKQFSKDFQCPIGSYMNPKYKCR